MFQTTIFPRPEHNNDAAIAVAGRAAVDNTGQLWCAADRMTRQPLMPWRSQGVMMPSGFGAGAGGTEDVADVYGPSDWPSVEAQFQTFTMRRGINPLKLPRNTFLQDAAFYRAIDQRSQLYAPIDAQTDTYRPPKRPALDVRLVKGYDDAWITTEATVTIPNATQWASAEPFMRTYVPPARARLVVPVHLSWRDDASWIFPAAASFSDATSAFAGAEPFTRTTALPPRYGLLDSRHLSFRDDTGWIFQAAQSGGQDIPGAWSPADSYERSLGMWRSTGVYLPSGFGAGAGGDETGVPIDPTLAFGIFDFAQTFRMRTRPTLDLRWQSFRGGGYAIDVAPPIGIGAIIPFEAFMTPRREGFDARRHLAFEDRAPLIFAAADFQSSISQFMSAMEFQRASFLMRKRAGLPLGMLESEKVDWIAGSFPVAFDLAWLAAINFQTASFRVGGKRYVWPLLTHPVDPQAWIYPVLPPAPVLTGGHRNRWPMLLRRWHQMGMRQP